MRIHEARTVGRVRGGAADRKETRKRVLVQGHPLTLESMDKLAYLLRALGRRKSALDLMSSCVDLSPHVLGPDHETLKLGCVSRRNGRQKTAPGWEEQRQAATELTDRLVIEQELFKVSAACLQQ